MHNGPTAPSPGPTLPTIAMEAVIDDMASMLLQAATKAVMAMIKKYKKINPATENTTSLRPTLPLICTLNTPWGWSIFFTSLVVCLDKITQRITFTPPAVEPEHPPTNISSNKKICALEGQRSKFTEEKPVVLMMEVVWKNASRKLSPKLLYV